MIEVSVICNCYNHEKYIKDALEGFVRQKTNFEFEVLIHDDASTDKSAEIIKEYERKYPYLIKPLYQKENQYSKKQNAVYRIQKERIHGKYVAICEGDDYWTDENKLQRQYDLLEKNPDIDVCTHRAAVIDATTGEYKEDIAPMGRDGLIDTAKVIEGDGGFVATNSLFFRSSVYINPMNFRENGGLDYPLQIQSSLRGGMLYINDKMSVYRTNCENSWTQRTCKNCNKYVLHCEQMTMMLRSADKETNYLYHKSFEDRIQFYEYEIYRHTAQYAKMLKNKFFREERNDVKLKVFVKAIIRYKK